MLAVAVILSIPIFAHAALFTFTSGDHSAALNITSSGWTLTMALTNTSTAATSQPIDLLTAVFFDFSGTASLTSMSANIASGSAYSMGDPTKWFAPASWDGKNVGGEWAYGSGLSGIPNGATFGISSTGLGIFGAPTFNGPNLAGPEAVDGGQFGIASAGPFTPNGGLSKDAVVTNSVIFTLTGFSGDVERAFSNVYFQYGTSLASTPVPEPGTMILLGTGLIGLAGYGRKRFRK
jgi:hypothetical protein